MPYCIVMQRMGFILFCIVFLFPLISYKYSLSETCFQMMNMNCKERKRNYKVSEQDMDIAHIEIIMFIGIHNYSEKCVLTVLFHFPFNGVQKLQYYKLSFVI